MPLLVGLVVMVLVVGCTGSSAPSPSPTASTPTSASPQASPTPSPTAVTPASATADKNSFKLTRIASGLRSPVYATYAPDGSGRLFIVEQVGRIRIFKDGTLLATPFLDIRSLVVAGGERGLLSVAFHPDFKNNGVFVVDYTRSSPSAADVGDTVIRRYTVSTPGAGVANRSSGYTLLTIDQPQANHNGGLVKFGPDGML